MRVSAQPTDESEVGKNIGHCPNMELGMNEANAGEEKEHQHSCKDISR